MPTLYILCGLPFSGKTTLAQAITQKRDLAYVNIDHVKADEGYFVSDDQVPDADWPGIYDVVHASLLLPLRLGRDVLYDASNLTRKERDDMRDLATKRAFAARVIYVAVPEATARARWQANKQTGERFDLPASVFEEALTLFEEPARDEDVIVYAPTQDVAKWIKANF
jgi:predicted kinase